MNASDSSLLIVEDDSDIREAFVDALVDEGYRVSSARNGREALTLLRNGTPPPSVILLDIMMPVMDGREFRAEQLADSLIASIPVVIITADSHDAIKAKELGAQSSLRKPIHIRDLFSVAERFCGARVVSP